MVDRRRVRLQSEGKSWMPTFVGMTWGMVVGTTWETVVGIGRSILSAPSITLAP
jgi:hypothetical protein